MTASDSFAATLQERAMRAKQARPVQPVGEANSTARSEPVRRVSNAKGRVARHLLPAAEELADWIEKATHALSRGVVWERGSILNVLV